ncbi:creatininase family protein [Halegenticoccus soli]|uniref:creatininase family protein n=1 Tax=Halegenticoccus soli TaxID=1985678 RepID=UPI000C6DA262|nr:creatininase family protein [Halegenticoccus soli]
MSRNLLAERTTTSAKERFDGGSTVAVLPVGAVEQHGPALPLGTDFMTAEAAARNVDRDEAVVLPTIPVGVSDHHRQFDGTLWAEPETFESYVADVLASVASHGVSKAVVVNGHGGNVESLRRVARRLRAAGTAFVAPWSWWGALSDLAEELFGVEGIGHADAMETSMMYAVNPQLVREDALPDAEAGASPVWGKRVHGAEVGFDTADFSESGATGTPTDGSPEAGRRLFDRASEELDALVGWLADQRFEDLLPRDHR